MEPIFNRLKGQVSAPPTKMFSVVIIVRQINDYLRQAMPWFARQTSRDFEIIVVSEAEERESFPDTRIITSGRASPSRA